MLYVLLTFAFPFPWSISITRRNAKYNWGSTSWFDDRLSRQFDTSRTSFSLVIRPLKTPDRPDPLRNSSLGNSSLPPPRPLLPHSPSHLPSDFSPAFPPSHHVNHFSKFRWSLEVSWIFLEYQIIKSLRFVSNAENVWLRLAKRKIKGEHLVKIRTRSGGLFQK